MSSDKQNNFWLVVSAVFALQLAAWAAWFIIASQHPVKEVPLATGR